MALPLVGHEAERVYLAEWRVPVWAQEGQMIAKPIIQTAFYRLEFPAASGTPAARCKAYVGFRNAIEKLKKETSEAIATGRQNMEICCGATVRIGASRSERSSRDTTYRYSLFLR